MGQGSIPCTGTVALTTGAREEKIMDGEIQVTIERTKVETYNLTLTADELITAATNPFVQVKGALPDKGEDFDDWAERIIDDGGDALLLALTGQASPDDIKETVECTWIDAWS